MKIFRGNEQIRLSNSTYYWLMEVMMVVVLLTPVVEVLKISYW